MTVVVLLTVVCTGICTPDWIEAAVLVRAATFGEEMIFSNPWFSAAERATSRLKLSRMLPSRTDAIVCATDVSRREDIERLAKRATDAFGRIDVWLNNAGVGAIGRFERIPLDVHEHVITTDLLGVLYGTYCADRQFLPQGSGVLINIASELGFGSVPYYSSYTAAKHGVTGLSDSLRQEAKQNGHDDIHICTIMPTAHDTPFFEHAANYSGHEIKPPKPVHDPQHVIERIVRVAANPRDKDIVGGDGVVKLIAANVMPAVAEKMGASQMHKTIEKEPPTTDTPGAVIGPMAAGSEIDSERRKNPDRLPRVLHRPPRDRPL